MRFLKDWLFGKDLSDTLGATKTIRAKGIKFKIKRLNVLNHMEGLNVLVQTYSTYDQKRQAEKTPTPEIEKMMSKVKEVYRDIFLASVVWPKLSAKPDGDGQYVDALFADWELCHALYEQIMAYTNKKKLKNPTSLNQSFLR
jgi:hypothetical protein